MGLSLVTAPATEPLTLDEAKTHLRVFHSDEDALISGLILSVRQHAESFTHRCFITQTWDERRDVFPSCGPIWLTLAPVASVSSISYVDQNGTTQTWSSSLYRTDLPSGPWAQGGRIEPAYGEYFPTTRSIVNAVTIRMVAGYGTAASVPGPILSAMKILLEHWYRYRGAAISGTIIAPVPMSVDALLWPYKVF